MNYTHPISWFIKNVDNPDMIKIFWDQLNDTGKSNVKTFLRYYSDEIQQRWNDACGL